MLLICFIILMSSSTCFGHYYAHHQEQWRTEGRGFGLINPTPNEIPKALQNRAKLNPIVETVKNC